jgi:hypothetical protein
VFISHERDDAIANRRSREERESRRLHERHTRRTAMRIQQECQAGQ